MPNKRRKNRIIEKDEFNIAIQCQGLWVLLVVVVAVMEVVVWVTDAFLRRSYSYEFVLILVVKLDIHFQLVLEALMKRKEELFGFNFYNTFIVLFKRIFACST